MRSIQRLILAMALSVLVAGEARADNLAGDVAYSAGDYTTAFREWSRAADSGETPAMVAVGTLYDTGLGVGQDFARALAWYQRAAEAGDVRGMFNTGLMYDNGRGTTADRPKAIEWYRRAADRGNGRAGYAAGLMFRDGDGVPRDRAAAIRYFRIAAQGGIGAARANLAALHADVAPGPAPVGTAPPPGRPALTADATALERVRRAVLARAQLDPIDARILANLAPTLVSQTRRQGALAQYETGYALEHGIGVTRDPVRSFIAYLRASATAEQGVKTAALRGAADVARTLTEAQHAKARDMLLDNAP